MNNIDIQEQLHCSDLLRALLFYDYFLTLEWEVSRYWGSRLTVPNALFYLNRYATLLGTIPVVIQYFWMAAPTPNKLEYFAVATQTLIGIMLIIRTYALYDRDRRVLAFMICVSAGVIAVGVWSVLGAPDADPGEKIDVLPFSLGCATSVPFSQRIGLAAAWAGMGVFDCTIFFLTVYRALSKTRAHGIDLFNVLLRDGSIYFGVIVLSNLSNILTFIPRSTAACVLPRADPAHANTELQPYTRGLPTTFINVISSLMITRLMLNLRDPALAHTRHPASASPLTDTGPGLFSTYVTGNDAECAGDISLAQCGCWNGRSCVRELGIQSDRLDLTQRKSVHNQRRSANRAGRQGPEL
ncbi:hypothetical protein B0H15DRAFT_796166 [Mycena belliarum]|uniref:DUF6533 domain-containing protein n=1 Tax=Mycena belliarum TaxID=1033014 RepID=A0AAD6UHC6_9AGAR|nr:hypothetical protein B0H15DRAFT_796166 [Mycena belliae]